MIAFVGAKILFAQKKRPFRALITDLYVKLYKIYTKALNIGFAFCRVAVWPFAPRGITAEL